MFGLILSVNLYNWDSNAMKSEKGHRRKVLNGLFYYFTALESQLDSISGSDYSLPTFAEQQCRCWQHSIDLLWNQPAHKISFSSPTTIRTIQRRLYKQWIINAWKTTDRSSEDGGKESEPVDKFWATARHRLIWQMNSLIMNPRISCLTFNVDWHTWQLRFYLQPIPGCEWNKIVDQ